MKYIKKFNENESVSELDDIRYFCEIYLIELIDRGCHVRINNRDSAAFRNEYIRDTYTYSFFLFLGIGMNMPKWIDIKDIFIPFLEMFIAEYDPSIITLLGSTSTIKYEYTYESLLSDNNEINGNTLIRSIKFSFNTI